MINTYKPTDSGAIGKTFEKELKAFFNQRAQVSAQGKIDMRKNRINFEVKTGAGEVDYLFNSKVKYTIYVPVVFSKNVVNHQEGFILESKVFLQVLEECGLLRKKISSAGIEKTTIQTFWNNAKNAPHGSKYYRLIDSLYEHCIMTLEDFCENGGRL